MTTPPISIDIRTLESAAQAVYGNSPAQFGLTPMAGANGSPLTLATVDGCTAAAYLDGKGDVVIAYQGTTSTHQQALDAAFMLGAPLSKLAGFSEAVAFARTVEAQAANDGIAASKLFVTGHSLGGTLAEYVSLKTGLPGAAFAGSGLNGYSNGTAASNFVSFVDRGDPFANYATDGAESSIAQLASPHMDHYGNVALLGTQGDSKTLMSFITAVKAAGVASNPIAALEAAAKPLAAAFANHGLGKYDPDIATQFGTRTIAQIAALEAPTASVAIAGSMHEQAPGATVQAALTKLAVAIASSSASLDAHGLAALVHL